MTTTQAPAENFVITKMTVATAVTTAPVPLTAARRRQRGGRERCQCTTRPAWANVKPVNTPTANRGMGDWVLPFTASSRAADRAARTQMAAAYTWRSPRMAKRCGRWSSPASRLASTGRPPNEVLAASASTAVVAIETTK